MSQTPVEVRRSARRRRTVSAYREGDRIVVLIPARMTRAQEAEWVETMVAKVERAEAAGIDPDRIVNTWPKERLLEWANPEG